MQIEVLRQQVVNGRIKARAAFWRDGTPTTDPPLLIEDFDLPLVTSIERRVTDATGRFITLSGKRVMPVVEINDEWHPRPDNPDDPYQTETVAVNATAHARRQALAWAEYEAAKLEE